MKHAVRIIALIALAIPVRAEYKDTMDPNGPVKNLKTDYGLVDDNAQKNQSDTLQKAIDDISAAGGGRLVLPKGVYRCSGIYMKSNVHLLIEKNTVIKPYWPKGEKTVAFTLSVPGRREKGHIENVSIRGMGGSFIIDYSDRTYAEGEGIRAVNCRQVRNFLLSDFVVKDNFTTYCAVIFTPAKPAEARNWEVFRPTDGLVKNCKSTNCRPGYGLVQMHAGKTIHFEHLSATGGGVTLRLETGAGGLNGGIHNITAKDICCEDGMSAVLLGPHKAQNGVVKVDGVEARGCAFGVQMGPGYVEAHNRDNPLYKPGVFADGTSVENIHVTFGTNAPVPLKHIGFVPKPYLKSLRPDPNDRKGKFARGPSVAAAMDRTGDSWNPTIKNLTSEGFTYNKGILTEQDRRPGSFRELLKGLSILEALPERQAKKARKR